MKLSYLLLVLFGCVSSAHAVTYPLPAGTDSVIGEVQYISARYEDTLLSLGRQYSVGYEEMIAANPGVSVWLPGEGTRIVIPTRYVLPDTPRTGIVVNVAEQRIYYYPQPQKDEAPTVQTFPVSIGKMDWSTPLGQTRITEKRMNPAWYPPASVRKEHAARGDYLPAVVPPGKDNPLGEFAMRLAIPGGAYLIHGTNKPTAIGMDVTHGCIRMFPEDIERFFKEVPVGTSVLIIDQPYKMGWSGDELYMETHQLLEGSQHAEEQSLTSITRMFVGATKVRPARLDWQDAERVFRNGSGLPMVVKLVEQP